MELKSDPLFAKVITMGQQKTADDSPFSYHLLQKLNIADDYTKSESLKRCPSFRSSKKKISDSFTQSFKSTYFISRLIKTYVLRGVRFIGV